MRFFGIVALILALSGANAETVSTKMTSLKKRVDGAASVPSLELLKQQMCWPWYAGCEDKAGLAYKDAIADYEAENGSARSHSDTDAAAETMNFAAKHEQEVIAQMEARNQAAQEEVEATQNAANAHITEVTNLAAYAAAQ